MPNAPKQVEEQLNQVLNAWTTLAANASFGGMTLAEFKTKIQPSLDARNKVNSLNDQLTAAQDARDDADKVTTVLVQKVVKGVVGDPNYGDDSDLYDAMGYVRKSARASGLSRGAKAAAAKTPPKP
jgi:hypothetical protein